MLGVTVLYALAGGTDYSRLTDELPAAPAAAVGVGVLCVLAGLMFKAGGVPAHFWVPDAAQGNGSTAATFLTTVPKIVAMVDIYRLVYTVSTDQVFWFIFAASLVMTLI